LYVKKYQTNRSDIKYKQILAVVKGLQQSKIFERFYRAPGSREKTFPGFGLGLYIADEIVRRHGGQIEVVSEEGKDSTFSLALPIAK